MPEASVTATRLVQQVPDAETVTVTVWPAVPANVANAVWPGVVVVSVRAVPFSVSVPASTSAGTSHSANVTEPTRSPAGFRRSVYVPAAGSVVGPAKALLVARGPTAAPSGPNSCQSA